MKPTPDQGGQWGILGGTFDPVHIGHLTLASEVCLRRELAGVVLVPSVRHPFKQGQCHASLSDRVAMLKLAVEEYDRLLVSEIEVEMDLSGYTLDTVRALKERYAQVSFYFIMGIDNLYELQKWYKPDDILKEVKILVGCRSPYDNKLPNGFPSGRIEVVRTTLVNVSSSGIRQKIRNNMLLTELDKLIPPKVREYIQQRKLYT